MIKLRQELQVSNALAGAYLVNPSAILTSCRRQYCTNLHGNPLSSKSIRSPYNYLVTKAVIVVNSQFITPKYPPVLKC